MHTILCRRVISIALAYLNISSFSLKDLRNAIAHNSAVYDVRFKRAKIGGQLRQMLLAETSVKEIDFQTITDYVVLIVYLLRRMKVSKTECKQVIRSYSVSLESLRSSLKSSDYHKIVKTDARSILKQLRQFVSDSD